MAGSSSLQPPAGNAVGGKLRTPSPRSRPRSPVNPITGTAIAPAAMPTVATSTAATPTGAISAAAMPTVTMPTVAVPTAAVATAAMPTRAISPGAKPRTGSPSNKRLCDSKKPPASVIWERESAQHQDDAVEEKMNIGHEEEGKELEGLNRPFTDGRHHHEQQHQQQRTGCHFLASALNVSFSLLSCLILLFAIAAAGRTWLPRQHPLRDYAEQLLVHAPRTGAFSLFRLVMSIDTPFSLYIWSHVTKTEENSVSDYEKKLLVMCVVQTPVLQRAATAAAKDGHQAVAQWLYAAAEYPLTDALFLMLFSLCLLFFFFFFLRGLRAYKRERDIETNPPETMYCSNRMTAEEFANREATYKALANLMKDPEYLKMKGNRVKDGAEAWNWQLRARANPSELLEEELAPTSDEE